MKILVVSDSHEKDGRLYDIMSMNTSVDMVIHLGDGEADIDTVLRELPAFGNKRIIRVRGNCDYYSAAAVTSFDNICGYNFYITHGFMQDVKYGLDAIYMDAKKNDRNVVLFGHTHCQKYIEKDGIHLFNPGAAKNYEYGIIEINEATKAISFTLK